VCFFQHWASRKYLQIQLSLYYLSLKITFISSLYFFIEIEIKEFGQKISFGQKKPNIKMFGKAILNCWIIA
jgi:hypothetical protein